MKMTMTTTTTAACKYDSVTDQNAADVDVAAAGPVAWALAGCRKNNQPNWDLNRIVETRLDDYRPMGG